jgi:glycosyltransferase involved in cell wall biosynthesis
MEPASAALHSASSRRHHRHPAASSLEISVLLSTYQKPWHLRMSLASIAMQEGVAGRMELIVTDDGSVDETPQIVEQFARTVPFPVRFTTHTHETFQLSRSRNEGVRASTAPYLLFVDGDCVLPPDHVRQHLEHRQPNCVMAGNYCLLDEVATARFTEEAIRNAEYLAWIPRDAVRRLTWSGWRAWFYELIRHPRKPRLVGNNIAIWRTDYEQVNGFDENFQGWGGEDDDLHSRLRRKGLRIRSILRSTRLYHLWHPPTSTKPPRVCDGANVAYLMRRGRLSRCINGLAKRNLHDLRFRVVGASSPDEYVSLLPSLAKENETVDVEILFLPGQGRFSGRADCNVLVVSDDCPAAAKLARQADFLVANRPYGDVPADHCFRLEAFSRALRAIG